RSNSTGRRVRAHSTAKSRAAFAIPRYTDDTEDVNHARITFAPTWASPGARRPTHACSGTQQSWITRSWLAVARIDIVSHVSTISSPSVPRGTANRPITWLPSSSV